MTVKIDQGLVDHFIDQSFGLPIAHENAAYTPTPGTAYVELRVLPNAILPATVKDFNDTTGVFQFILRYPEGGGAITAKAQADAIFAAYPIGLEITYDGQKVTITAQDRPDAYPEDGWYKVRGLIFYEADIPRAA